MDDHAVRLRNALIRQHQIVFDYDTKRIKEDLSEHIDCPVCDSNEKVTAFSKDWFNFSKCVNCGMVYLNPRLNDKATYQFYNSEWNAIYNERKFEGGEASTRIDDKRNDENLKLISQSNLHRGKLLEIGIGNGYFLKRAQVFGYDVYGVELNKKNCEMASVAVGDSHKIFNADLFSIKFDSNMFDVIYMKDVFEHVPNPRKMLAEFNRIAKKGCVLFIEVPNIEGWIFKIFRERHVCIFAFEHLNYWSPQTLEKVLVSEGFAVHDVKHESDDFTPACILSYIIDPAFTSIEGKKSTGLTRFILRVIRKLFTMPPLAYMDGIFKKMPDLAGRGSQIKVIAVKQ